MFFRCAGTCCNFFCWWYVLVLPHPPFGTELAQKQVTQNAVVCHYLSIQSWFSSLQLGKHRWPFIGGKFPFSGQNHSAHLVLPFSTQDLKCDVRFPSPKPYSWLSMGAWAMPRHAEMRGDGDPKLPRITNPGKCETHCSFASWQKTWRFHSQWLILCRICHRQLVSELILGQATWARAEHDEHDPWRMINDLPSGDGLFYHLMTNDDFGDGLILGCWPIDTQSQIIKVC